MIITPKDIAAYTYCPMLYYKGRQDKFLPKLTLFEKNLRQSFILAEEKVLLKNTIVSVQKLTNAWDSIWWPEVMKHKVEMAKAKNTTIKATERFIDYCNYEMTDYLWPTVGVDVESRIDLGRATLVANVDIIKVNLDKQKRNTVLLNFTNRELSIRDAAFDNLIKTIAYAFYTGNGETITHLNVNISEQTKKIQMGISHFDKKDMDDIRRMIYHVKTGICTGVKYMNPMICKGCGVCPEYNY